MPSATPVAPPPETAPNVDLGIVEDANAGRSWLAPTALTEPAGTWSFSDYELLLVSLGYAVTDQLSVSATTMLPMFEGMPFWLIVNAKYQLFRQGQVRLALQGALTTVRDDGDSATAGVVGGALTLCIDPECRSFVHGYVGAGFAYEDQSAVPLAFSGSVAFAVGKHVKLLLEADTGYVAGGGIDAAANGFLGWYGVRFTSKIIGVDFGLHEADLRGLRDRGPADGHPVPQLHVALAERLTTIVGTTCSARRCRDRTYAERHDSRQLHAN